MAITLDGSNANTVGVINSKTAVASTSGTSIDFTGIPAGVKRITVMFNGVSTNGTSSYLVQVGSGSITSSGYAGYFFITTTTRGTSTTGFTISGQVSSASIVHGSATICLISGNTWVETGVTLDSGFALSSTQSAGSVALSGTLDRVRITTVNGTDTFDAGSINILYE
jgi:hypothetical protein